MERHPKHLLRNVTVRLIRHEERGRWERLMRENHYLGYRTIVGNALRYVGIFEGEWVALLGWGAAALKNRHRDRWIGWSNVVQWERLKYISNNVRYLILRENVPNLASRVLSLNLKCLSSDWEAVYGHPIFLAETFIDRSRFKGVCYRASGWIELGQTRGFRRNADKYYHHGRPKSIFIRPLHRNALRLLSDPFVNPDPRKEELKVNVERFAIEEKNGLIDYLRKIPEPRKSRGIRHHKLCILAVAICAILGGAKSFAAIGEWAASCSQSMLRRLRCRKNKKTGLYVPPSEPTIRRLLQRTEAQQVDKVINEWIYSQIHCSAEEAIAIDGKTLKGSKSRDGKMKHLLSAFLQQQRVVIAQQDVDGKSNEITAVAPLLENINIEGMVVTADAMHTQTKTAELIVKGKKADYLFTIKDNQSTLKDDVESLHLESFPPSV